MPLYETIIISRCGEAKGTAVMLKQLAVTALSKGGNVRDMKILGDRILTKSVRGNDGKTHLLGRYVQILYDGNQDVKKQVESSAKSSFEYLRVQTFKQKDFLNEAQMYQRAFNQTSPIIDEQQVDREYIHNILALTKI